MSIWDPLGGKALPRERLPAAKVTVPSLLERKQPLLQTQEAQPARICCVTAYDYPSARMADAAGLDVVLVGDSLAMTMLGHESTLAVTMDEMLVFTRAVRRGLQRALLVADMPYGSYQADDRTGVENALRFVKEAGAEAVKLEGAHVSLARRLVEAEVPVMGHLGLTPQAVNRMGGYKVQAKTHDAIENLREQAHRLADAGCFSIVLEGIPREVAATLTGELPVPTIGIGAGPDCDGQILVWHDLLGLTHRAAAKFVRRYLDGAEQIGAALERYARDVEAGVFPSDAECYHLPPSSRHRREELAEAVV